MTEAFLITGGGSGAKVAEALVHLCAAGLGPRHLHLLIIDADSTNGNVTRTLDTIDTYVRLQNWPWTVSWGRQPEVSTSLFKTHIHVYTLLEKVKIVSEAGLDGAVEGDPELAQVIRLLFDESERKDKHADGFRARPNVGCLLLENHVTRQMEDTRNATSDRNISGFVTALLAATDRSEWVPIMMVGSVFGGTGASLMPIARTCIESEFTRRSHAPRKQKLKWGRIMMLPYFKPKDKISKVERDGSAGVYIDPDRFLLDASSALQFYGLLQERKKVEGADGSSALDADDVTYFTYLIGSDDPASNQTHQSIGSKEQVNPAFVEELFAAQAVLHFIRFIEETLKKAKEEKKRPTMEEAVHVFTPKMNDGRLIDLQHLPGGTEVRRNLAFLLHLAGFFLRIGDEQSGECSHGLWKYMQFERNKNAPKDKNKRSPLDFEELVRAGWFDSILHDWIDQISVSEEAQPLKNVGRNRGQRMQVLLEHKDGDRSKDKFLMRVASRDVSEYFCRLLLWAGTCLLGKETAIMKLDGSDYISIHNGLCRISPVDIERKHHDEKDYTTTDDNALVRLLRASLAAMLAEHRQKHFHREHSFLLHDQAGRSVPVGLQAANLAACMRQVLQDAEVSIYLKTYGWTNEGPGPVSKGS